MKTETGVMVMKDGKGWGMVSGGGGHGEGRIDGWVDPEDAIIHDPQFCTQPTDVTYPGSFDIRELSTAKLVKVVRKTTVEIL